MIKMEDSLRRAMQDAEIVATRHSGYAHDLRPIPVRPPNINYFGNLPYLPDPYSSLMEDADRITGLAREKGRAESQAGFAQRTQLGLTPQDARRYSTSINPSTSPNGAPPLIEETRAHIMAVMA